MCRFGVIAPYRFLCSVSSEPKIAGHDVTLSTADQVLHNALKDSTQAIGVCVVNLTPKRGKNALNVEGGDAEAEEEDPDD
jgi:hypothetical protein